MSFVHHDTQTVTHDELHTVNLDRIYMEEFEKKYLQTQDRIYLEELNEKINQAEQQIMQETRDQRIWCFCIPCPFRRRSFFRFFKVDWQYPIINIVHRRNYVIRTV